jgi:hypothetical protein
MHNNNDRVMDASSLVIRGPLPTENIRATTRTPSSVVEAAIRVLGTMLVLYRHYVPNSEHYKVHDKVVQ